MWIWILILSGILSSTPGSCIPMQEITIFHAGSLTLPLKQIAELFEIENPNTRINLEAAGSRTCARKISDLNRDCDVMISADYAVINSLLIPDYATWNIKFARNEMVIAYKDGATIEDTLSSETWLDIFLNKGVRYGRSDPHSDPCGYRSVLLCKLAEKYYKRDGVAQNLLKKDQRYIRPKETDLLILLELGEIDYIFIYRSVARQHNLKILSLPDEINLGQFKLESLYQSVSVELSGKKPGETIQRRGQPIIYGITIPTKAPNPNLAMDFIVFFLSSDKGLKILEASGQAPVVPAFTESYSALPDLLKPFARSSQ